MNDWNELTIEQSVQYLRNKYLVDSSGDSKCIYNLIKFYDQRVKNHRVITEDENEGFHICPYCNHKEVLINDIFNHMEWCCRTVV